MNTGNIILITTIALVIGYSIGHEKKGLSAYSPPLSVTSPIMPEESRSSKRLDEIRSQLEEARYAAQRAKDAADNAEFQAFMRSIESGRTDDMMRHFDAQDSLDRANESLERIEDALNNTN